MSDTTIRLGLPTIRAGQAQKESSHNEALAAIDLLLHPCALSAGLDTPPSDPEIGQAWVVGDAPVGDWTGRGQHLAGWTAGGWRFAAPFEGLTVWLSEAFVFAQYSDGGWTIGEVSCKSFRLNGRRVLGPRGMPVGDPSGGSVIDLQARAAIVALLARIRSHGLIDS